MTPAFSPRLLVAALLAGAIAMPAIAQGTAAQAQAAQTTAAQLGTQGVPPPGTGAQEVERGYDNPPMPGQAAINAGSARNAAALNNQVAAAQQAHAQMTAAQQAQYDADRAAYERALIAHHHAVRRTDARYMRQQRAYADAMAVWREQVAACRHGHRKACDMPPPRVSDYY